MQYGNPHPIAEVKARDDSWEVSGYLSTYGNVDFGGDVVLRGAFDDSVKDWEAGRKKIRFLRQHSGDLVLGVPLGFTSDEKGLLGRFKISKTALGEETHTLLKDGALDSFSIGYIAQESDFDDTGVRKLRKVDLLEGSIVAIPMNERALVTTVKALEGQPVGEILRAATETLTYAVAEAKALHDRRASEGRKLADAHLEALDELIAQAEAALALKDLRTELQPAEAARSLTTRLELARRRLERAGLLERTIP